MARAVVSASRACHACGLGLGELGGSRHGESPTPATGAMAAAAAPSPGIPLDGDRDQSPR